MYVTMFPQFIQCLIVHLIDFPLLRFTILPNVSGNRDSKIIAIEIWPCMLQPYFLNICTLNLIVSSIDSINR